MGSMDLPVAYDSWVDSQAPTLNKESDASLRTGVNPSNGARLFSYLKVYGWGNIPQGANITSGYFHFRVLELLPSTVSVTSFRLQMPSSVWSSTTITWSNMPSGSYMEDGNITVRGSGWHVATATHYAQETYIGNSSTNIGLRMITETTPRDGFIRFASIDHSNSAVRPFVRVSWNAIPPTHDPVENRDGDRYFKISGGGVDNADDIQIFSPKEALERKL